MSNFFFIYDPDSRILAFSQQVLNTYPSIAANACSKLRGIHVRGLNRAITIRPMSVDVRMLL